LEHGLVLHVRLVLQSEVVERLVHGLAQDEQLALVLGAQLVLLHKCREEVEQLALVLGEQLALVLDEQLVLVLVLLHKYHEQLVLVLVRALELVQVQALVQVLLSLEPHILQMHQCKGRE
jgi:predicted ribosome-associated RNA-binding protein Tma20